MIFLEEYSLLYYIIVLFVETPRKFITAKLSIRKPGSSSVLIICYMILLALMKTGLTDRKLCSNKFTWCFHKQLNYYIFYRHANIQRTYYYIINRQYYCDTGYFWSIIF